MVPLLLLHGNNALLVLPLRLGQLALKTLLHHLVLLKVHRPLHGKTQVATLDTMDLHRLVDTIMLMVMRIMVLTLGIMNRLKPLLLLLQVDLHHGNKLLPHLHLLLSPRHHHHPHLILFLLLPLQVKDLVGFYTF